MAVKKETAQQAAEAATQDTKDVQAEKPATEVIHLFKDNGLSLIHISEPTRHHDISRMPSSA